VTSRHLVAPELLPLIDAQPDLNLSAESLPALRAMFAAQLAAMPPPEGQPVEVSQIMVPARSDAPPVRMLAYRPTQSPGTLPAILHFHGGGYVFGSPEMTDAANRALSIALGCAIFSVDYRLAPETPHPGPIEDCYAALIYLHAHATALGIDPTRIGLKGESAGGGLAASLALLARDRREVPIAFQHLIYPMIDDRTCVNPDPHPLVGDYIWTRPTNMFGWASLLGTAPGSPGISPYAAAARADSLAGLPPCFIALGSLDLFLEEDLDYARRLTRAGVPVELHVYPGAVHAFQLNPTARLTIEAECHSRAALRLAMA
jgi:triacylglycerol lipase